MIRILLLGLVLAGVWYLYRMVTQQNATAAPTVAPANDAAPPEAAPQAEAAAEAAPEPAPETGPEPSSEQAASEQGAALEEAASAEAQDMIECPMCQAYVPETAHDGCGRPDCPIPALAADRAQG